MPALNQLYKDYRDRAEFYVVYIQEAHPVDAWQVSSNVKDDVLVKSTATDEERTQVAGLCLKKLKIDIPAIVDGADDGVERAYTGWPDRLYVIDGEGRIAHKSAAGPFGFEPKDVESKLKELVAKRAGL